MTIAQKIGLAALDQERKSRVLQFLQVARCLVVGGGDPYEAAAEASRSRVIQPVRDALANIQKASVAAATTSDSTWAAPLAQSELSQAFAETLVDASAFDRLLPDMLRVPPLTKIASITAGISGASVGESQVKPAGKLTAVSIETTMKKSVAFVVLTKELARMSSAGALAFLQRELTKAVATVTDTTFISDLTASITAIPSSGGTALGVRADLRAAADAVDTGSSSKLYWITTSSIAKRLSVIGDSAGGPGFPETAEGRLGAWPLVISDGVGSGLLILCDSSQIAASALPLELDSTNEASIQLDDNPDSPASSATNLVSLFQNNFGAIRATRYFAIKRLRDTAVAVISSVTGLGNSPS